MYDRSIDINKQLVAISEAIDYYIANGGAASTDLQVIEHWMKNHFEKLQMRNLKNSFSKSLESAGHNPFRDGIIVFDRAFRVLHFSGPLNYFSKSISNQDAHLTLLDLIAKNDHEKFLKEFGNINFDTDNHTIDLLIETGTGLTNPCEFEVDTQTSNRVRNRFVAYLKFNYNVERQLADYQSIMLDNLPGMDIYLFDKEYRFKMAGGKEKTRFGLNNNDFVGKTLFEVLDKKTRRIMFPFYSKALSGQKTEGEARFRDEMYYVNAAPIKDNNGQTIAGVAMVQNITKDKELEKQLEKAKEDAQKANRAKSIFIANMSHEIRTPLSAIIGFTEQLEKIAINEDQKEYINFIKKASDHLLHLVTEVVFLFKLGMGKVYIEKVPFLLLDLIEELENIFLRQASEKQLKFELEMDPNLPEVLIGDPYRLRQILMNLLVNAVKYTPIGQVKLTCRIKEKSQNNYLLRFEVEDTGAGISEEDLPYIFDYFEQGNFQHKDTKDGAGLGLGICQRLVLLLNGEITVDSKLNSGSKFSVELPFLEGGHKELIVKEKQFNPEEQHLTGKKILLADDDEHNLLLAKMMLSNWKTNYFLANNGEEALNMLQKEKFDLLLLDVNMPKMSGIEVIREIRGNKQNPNHKSPALTITANAMKKDINLSMDAGFDDYLIKPFREIELYNKICNILFGDNLPNRQPEEHNAVQQETTETDEFLVEELEATASGDHHFFNMMIDNFIDSARQLVIDFHQNLLAENWKTIGEKAHKAIPSFKFFAMNNLGKKLEHIEDLALRHHNYGPLPKIVQETTEQIEKAIDIAKTKKKDL